MPYSNESRFDMIKRDALWVITHFGSNAEEKVNPGSKAREQAERIATFVEQLDEAEGTLDAHHIDLVHIERNTD